MRSAHAPEKSDRAVHIARTGNTAREMWKLMDPEAGNKEAQAGS
jgi:hypothetical protein